MFLKKSTLGPLGPGESNLTCPACATSVPSGARFCPSCGGAIRVEGGASDGLRDRLQAAVEGTFSIERLLGRGGMGAVYLAREPALDRLVAIKVLPPERAQSSDLRERFRREARTAAQLSHPHIVPLLTFGEEDGLMYFVMGYVEGEALSARVHREGRLEVVEAVRVLSELAQALSYAHSRFVVHRDVKPENVLLEQPKALVRLTDFGVAKGIAAASSLTTEGSVIGTPLFMSPEQASGRIDVDARTDIYSLGAVAFTLFTGRPPFDGRSASEIMRQHLTRDVPLMRDHVPGIPAAIDDAVRRCLAKEPSARWRDAVEFSTALQAAGDSWWGALLRRARPAAASVSSPAPTVLGSISTPSPSSPSDFRSALLQLAGGISDEMLASRVKAMASRLADETAAVERGLIGLQMAADPVELRRTDKRLASLREVVDPAAEVTATIDALERLRAASQAAVQKVDAGKSARASAISALRRLYSAARRSAAAPEDKSAREDLNAACQNAVSEGATNIAADDKAETTAR